MNTVPATDLCTQAKQRVTNSETLSKFHDFIMADWNEGDENWQWILDASEDEIVGWCFDTLNQQTRNSYIDSLL